MGRLRIIYLGFVTFLTLLIYITIFGDAGLLARQDLESRLTSLRLDLSELQEENQLLDERYIQLSSHSLTAERQSVSDENLPKKRPIDQRAALLTTIVRIESTESSGSSAAQAKARAGQIKPFKGVSYDSLEARSLFLFTMTTLALSGLWLLNRFAYNLQRPRHSAKEEPRHEAA